jgi:Cytochrome P450
MTTLFHINQTSVVIETFILAMLLHPDVYRTAQVEMDNIVGLKRLPDLNDRDSLPYLDAVLKETYRYVINPIQCPFIDHLVSAQLECPRSIGYVARSLVAIVIHRTPLQVYREN